MGLRAKVWQGIRWAGAGLASQSIFRLLTLAVLARLLQPADFGLVGMVTVVTGFAASFADLGLSGAIIQKGKCSRDELSSL